MGIPFGYSEITESEVALLYPSPAERVRFRIDNAVNPTAEDVDDILTDEGFKGICEDVIGGFDHDSVCTIWAHPKGDEVWVFYACDSERIDITYPEGIADSPSYL